MTKRHPFTYVLLRYRHDPRAGEFVNVGVVLHAPDAAFLKASVRKTLGSRLSKMFPDLEGDTLKRSLSAIARRIENVKESDASGMFARLGDAASFAHKALPTDDTSYVWGPIGSGVSSDPALTLESIFDRFVSQYDDKQRIARDDAAVWRPVRDLLIERQIADYFQAKTISSDIDTVEFEHAWKNGSWHCYQPLSFDLTNGSNIREKAARWAGHLLALGAAEEAFETHFLVGKPSDVALTEAYEQAIAILKLSPNRPQVIEEEAVEEMVNQIEDEIKSHTAGAIYA